MTDRDGRVRQAAAERILVIAGVSKPEKEASAQDQLPVHALAAAIAALGQLAGKSVDVKLLARQMESDDVYMKKVVPVSMPEAVSAAGPVENVNQKTAPASADSLPEVPAYAMSGNTPVSIEARRQRERLLRENMK